MRPSIIKYLLFILLSYFWNNQILKGQRMDFIVEVERLGQKEGLLGKRPQAIYTDKQGIVWIATTDGLNRYDGRTFKHYHAFVSTNYFDSHKLIIEDGDGWLWVIESFHNQNIYPVKHLVKSLTGEMVSIEDVIHYPLPFAWENLIQVTAGSNHKIYFLTRNKEIFIYESLSGFRKVIVPKDGTFLKILGDEPNGTIWLSMSDVNGKNHIVQLDSTGEILLFPVKYSPLFISFFKTNEAGESLFYDFTENQAEFFSIQNGEVLEQKLKKYSEKIKSEIPLDDSLYVSSLNHTQSSKILDQDGKVLYDFYENFEQAFYTKHFYFEQPDLLWIATLDGVLKLYFKINLFQHLNLLEASEDNLGKNNCRTIIRATNGDLMACYNKGIWKEGEVVNIYSLDKVNKVESLAIEEDRQGNFWLAYSNTLYCYKNDGTFEGIDLISKLPDGEEFNGIWSLYIDDANRLWIGGLLNQGYFDLKTHQFTIYQRERNPNRLSLNYIDIYAIQSDKSGNLLACTDAGLAHFDENREIFSYYWEADGERFLLPQQEVHHFYEEAPGIFWLAGENLTRWNRHTNEKRVFTIADGLPSKRFHAVYPDDFGNLWLSSENGIACFNKRTHEVKNYGISDGLVNEEFNRTSHFQDADGTIHFGGIDGIISFHPKDFQNRASKRLSNIELVFTGFEKFSADANSIVNDLKSVLNQQQIVMAPGDRFFKIDFTLPYYVNNEKIQYEYKIEGNQEEWTSISENYLRVSGLPFGSFNLKIRGKFPNGVYAQNELKMPIYVLKPFYLQTWFLALSGLFLLGLGWLFFKTRVRRLEAQKEHLEKLVAQRTATIESQKKDLEASNTFKDRLFAIIAHDMRNAVYGFKDVTRTIQTFIKFNQPQKIMQLSKSIDSSSNRLQHLLDNLLDWALSQRGELPYQPEIIEVSTLFDETIQAFEITAKALSIQIKKLDTERTEIFADRSAMETILRNLVGNAVKFTPTDGLIELRAFSDENRTYLSVRDTGIGMDEVTQKLLFSSNRKKIKAGERGQKGSGLGLLLVKELVESNHGQLSLESEIGVGTTFTIGFARVDKTNFKT